MDRRPRERPRLGWDVAPQALKEVNEMWASLGYYRQRMLLSHRSSIVTSISRSQANRCISHPLILIVRNCRISYSSHLVLSSLMPPVRGGHLLGGLITPIKINHSHESDGSVINILNLMDVAMDKTDASGTRSGVCDYLYTLCQQSFPSPLVCGNVGSREVNKWIDEKIANCKSLDMDYRKGEFLRLFFSLLKIACQYYGKLRSPFGTDHAMKGSKTHMGGTMRLGSRRTYFQVADCLSAKLYGNKSFIDERHRHRYEVNPDMVAQLEDAGLSFTGKDESGQHMEIVGLSSHPFYVGVQFHPEFKSRPGKPLALFLGLIVAACGQLDAVLKKSGTKTTAMSNGTSAIKSHQ